MAEIAQLAYVSRAVVCQPQIVARPPARPSCAITPLGRPRRTNVRHHQWVGWQTICANLAMVGDNEVPTGQFCGRVEVLTQPHQRSLPCRHLPIICAAPTPRKAPPSSMTCGPPRSCRACPANSASKPTRSAPFSACAASPPPPTSCAPCSPMSSVSTPFALSAPGRSCSASLTSPTRPGASACAPLTRGCSGCSGNCSARRPHRSPRAAARPAGPPAGRHAPASTRRHGR